MTSLDVHPFLLALLRGKQTEIHAPRKLAGLVELLSKSSWLDDHMVESVGDQLEQGTALREVSDCDSVALATSRRWPEHIDGLQWYGNDARLEWIQRNHLFSGPGIHRDAGESIPE